MKNSELTDVSWTEKSRIGLQCGFGLLGDILV